MIAAVEKQWGWSCELNRQMISPRENQMATRPEIKLDSGIEIRLDCLFQYGTYGGLLEGLPTRNLNAKLIERALTYATEKLWMKETPHLLVPIEVAMGVPRGEWFRPEDGEEPATIPAVVCLATFDSLAAARDPDADCSSLNVVWFQEEFGPPVEAAVLQQFRALDWRALATDGWW